jgi:hypothetical protein
MAAHATVWQHVNSMPMGAMAAKSQQIDAILPILGELSGNPGVTAKDVIKAASQAAADGIATPTEAVQFISQIPDDPTKLQGWLRGLYAVNLSAAVHMKARQMQPAQAPSEAPQTPAAPATNPMQAGPPPPVSMTPGSAGA